jgi:adenylate cyclase
LRKGCNSISLISVDTTREIRWNAFRIVAFGIITVNLFLESSHHNIAAYSAVAFTYFFTTATAIIASLYRPRWRNATMVYILADALLVAFVLYSNLLDTEISGDHNLTTTSLVIPFVLLNHVALRQDRKRVVLFSSVVFVTWVGMLIAQSIWHHNTGMAPFFSSLFNKDLGLAISFGFTSLAVYLFTAELQATKVLALQSDKMRRNLSRFFSPQLATTLQEKGSGLELVRSHAAVMFIDIRGFTRMSETIAPEALAKILAEYRQIASRSIFNNGGVVDKFTGDGILAVFGVPKETYDDCDRALACALEISSSLDGWLLEMEKFVGQKLSIGIGLHFGAILSGVVRSGHHDEFTVLGDTVNVAHRLERITKDHNASIVVSMDLVHALKFGFPSQQFMQLKSAKLPGRDARLDILYLPRPKTNL